MSKIFIIGMILFSFLIIGVSYFFLVSNSKPPLLITSYAVTDSEKPNIEAKETLADLGNVKVSDEKAKEFTIKNIGNKPLQLSKFTTSCGCTAVQIIYQGKTSQEFSMHAQVDYVAEIAPQTEATIKVIYRPYVMPVYGVVEREAYISTNDPLKPKLIFKVKSFVQ